MVNGSRDYLSGVLDSDGSLSITKRHLKRKQCNYTCMIQITWKYSGKAERYFKFLTEYYGGSYHRTLTHSNSYKPGTKILRYNATGKAAERILLDCRN